jgi:hypothetical protein
MSYSLTTYVGGVPPVITIDYSYKGAKNYTPLSFNSRAG